MARFLVSGTCTIYFEWSDDAEVTVDWKRTPDLGSGDFLEYGDAGALLQSGESKAEATFSVEVDADNETEAEDVVVDELSNLDSWECIINVGGSTYGDGVVSTYILDVEVECESIQEIEYEEEGV